MSVAQPLPKARFSETNCNFVRHALEVKILRIQRTNKKTNKHIFKHQYMYDHNLKHTCYAKSSKKPNLKSFFISIFLKINQSV